MPRRERLHPPAHQRAERTPRRGEGALEGQGKGSGQRLQPRGHGPVLGRARGPPARREVARPRGENPRGSAQPERVHARVHRRLRGSPARDGLAHHRRQGRPLHGERGRGRAPARGRRARAPARGPVASRRESPRRHQEEGRLHAPVLRGSVESARRGPVARDRGQGPGGRPRQRRLDAGVRGVVPRAPGRREAARRRVPCRGQPHGQRRRIYTCAGGRRVWAPRHGEVAHRRGQGQRRRQEEGWVRGLALRCPGGPPGGGGSSRRSQRAPRLRRLQEGHAVDRGRMVRPPARSPVPRPREGEHVA
mmetsp:Transcript_32578/g.62844  ORF Transcript_32578/g.62844 Transcript_32578/m.62844 type:complete len:306 (-) Transcript_32578:521-1438(-)